MQIKLLNGETKVTVNKTESRCLENARVIAKWLSEHGGGDYSQAATDVELGIEKLLAKIVEVKP